jgi:glycosyltransferase involved in cell wall biosynthesis
VVGDAGLLVDPTDVGAIADALTRIVGDGALRAALGQRGLRRARAFDVAVTGERAVAALHAALSG